MTPTIRSLQDKVEKVAREGGTLKWVLPNSEVAVLRLVRREPWDNEWINFCPRDV